MSPAPPLPQPQVVAPGAVIDWNSKRDGQGRTYVSGPYRLTLSGAHSPEGDGGGMLARITVTDAAQSRDHREAFQPVTLSGVASFPDNAYARVAVGRLDPASATYSVMVTSFSGGAHCCDDVQVATPGPTALTAPGGPAGWVVLHPGAFDGAQLGFGPEGARLPAGGAGVFGVSIPDSGFDYIYGCYACSHAPLRVYGLRQGRLVDRTGEAPFRPLLEADMRQAEAGCRHGEAGVCPGYLADAARLGLWAQGLHVLRQSIRGEPQWSYPDQLCDGVEVRTKCLPGQRAQPIPGYATSVRLFLRWRGYPVPGGAVAGPASQR